MVSLSKRWNLFNFSACTHAINMYSPLNIYFTWLVFKIFCNPCRLLPWRVQTRSMTKKKTKKNKKHYNTKKKKKKKCKRLSCGVNACQPLNGQMCYSSRMSSNHENRLWTFVRFILVSENLLYGAFLSRSLRPMRMCVAWWCHRLWLWFYFITFASAYFSFSISIHFCFYSI